MTDNFLKAFKELMLLEYSSKYNMLHKNKGENGFTFMGIYQLAHPLWGGWKIIKKHNYNVEKITNDKILIDKVKNFYYLNYWTRARLDSVIHFRIALEIFIFGVNVGLRTAVRKTQKLIGVTDDGIIGKQTLRALNVQDVEYFDMAFDEIEIEFYESLIKRRPSFKIFLKGWKRRAWKC